MAIVTLTKEAREQFDALPGVIQPRVQRILTRLTLWPNVSGAKPLSGKLSGRYRMRTGDYRVQFKPERIGGEWYVEVNKIGHRDGFYD